MGGLVEGGGDRGGVVEVGIFDSDVLLLVRHALLHGRWVLPRSLPYSGLA